VPPLRVGHPRWTCSTTSHAPIMVVCMGVMSSSFSPFLKKSRPRCRLYLKLILHNTKEYGVAKIKKTRTIVRRDVTRFPNVYHVMSHQIVSISRDFIIKRHMRFVITILQKISTNKRHNRNNIFIARTFSPKNHRETPAMLPFMRNKTREEHVNMFVSWLPSN
jgi:hypothetical protein